MPTLATMLAFGLVALAIASTPGPNMIYLISRSICQGRAAGFVSLAGVATGFLFYMVASALGITALLLVVPFAYDALRIVGVLYLLYLAWQAVRPGGRSPFAAADLPPDSPRRLFLMGLTTNLLNPKAAVLYLSLLPQFIHPAIGSPLLQGLVLGGVQIAASLAVNTVVITTAGGIARFLATRPGWQALQRWIMGAVLAGLAVRMAADARR